MNSEKLKTITIPDYSPNEEKINSISHLAGAVFGLAALIACIAVSFIHKNAVSMFSSFIYGTSVITLFLTSGIYHGLKKSDLKKVFRIIDHCAVFILIAGTYTPVLLGGLRQIKPQTSIIMFAAVWILSIAGITLNAVDFKKYKNFTLVCYLLVGWIIIAEIKTLYLAFGMEMLILLLAGGICFTVGALLYVIGKKKKYFHSVFHFFVLAGSIIHFAAIIKYFI